MKVFPLPNPMTWSIIVRRNKEVIGEQEGREEGRKTIGEPLQATIISSGLSRFTTAMPQVPSQRLRAYFNAFLVSIPSSRWIPTSFAMISVSVSEVNLKPLDINSALETRSEKRREAAGSSTLIRGNCLWFRCELSQCGAWRRCEDEHFDQFSRRGLPIWCDQCQ
jgi:hypothetical protein